VFQRDGKAIAAQWSAASGAWVEIGEVITTLLHYFVYDKVGVFSFFECPTNTACWRFETVFNCNSITTVMCAMISSITDSY
jgi:hypothetical protein